MHTIAVYDTTEKRKVTYLNGQKVQLDELCVSLYVLWDAELIFDAAAEITDHSFMVMIKFIVILDKMLACYRPELQTFSTLTIQ